jgi:hypothetical protein
LGAEKETFFFRGKKTVYQLWLFTRKPRLRKITKAGLLACFYAPSRLEASGIDCKTFRTITNQKIVESETYSYGDSAGL